MKRQSIIIVTGAALLLAGCAQTQESRDVTVSGFLGDYSILRDGGEGEAALVYIDETADWASYDKIWLDPVTVWADEDRFEGEEQQDVQNLADAFYTIVHERLAVDYEMVDGAEPGALRVQIALTDADSSEPGMDTISTVVPQMLLVSQGVGLVSDKPSFVGEAAAEVKVSDATSGELLAAAVDRRVGGKDLSGSFDEWSDVKAAMEYWANQMAYRLCTLQDGTDCTPPEA